MKKNEYVTFCKCGCGNGIVLKADNEDNDLSLQIVSDNFYFMQNKGKISLKEKRRFLNQSNYYFQENILLLLCY